MGVVVAVLSYDGATVCGVVRVVFFDEAVMGVVVAVLSCDEAAVNCVVAALSGMCRDELRWPWDVSWWGSNGMR